MRGLQDQLSEYLTGFKARAPAEAQQLMEGATAALRESGIAERALRVGDAAPELTLPDSLGRPVNISTLWANGPIVLLFYRGGWCPYCNLTLRAWAAQQEALMARGMQLVAVSPQRPDASLDMAEQLALPYPVLSDVRFEAAEAFGIGFELPPELAELYMKFGNDLPALSGQDRWVLPLPATYVIGTDGRIAYAHLDADYRQRAEPAEVLAAV
jgi:peroxiredoxin